MIKKFSLWQVYFIVDFFKFGFEVWWKWKEDGFVEFFDVLGQLNNREEGFYFYNFRFNNIS